MVYDFLIDSFCNFTLSSHAQPKFGTFNILAVSYCLDLKRYFKVEAQAERPLPPSSFSNIGSERSSILSATRIDAPIQQGDNAPRLGVCCISLIQYPNQESDTSDCLVSRIHFSMGRLTNIYAIHGFSYHNTAASSSLQPEILNMLILMTTFE